MEAPAVAAVQQQYADEVLLVGVAGRSDLGAIQDFIETLPVEGFDHAVDDDGSLWAAYDIFAQPAFTFLNDDGTVQTHIGPLGEAQLSERIDALLAS